MPQSSPSSSTQEFRIASSTNGSLQHGSSNNSMASTSSPSSSSISSDHSMAMIDGEDGRSLGPDDDAEDEGYFSNISSFHYLLLGLLLLLGLGVVGGALLGDNISDNSSASSKEFEANQHHQGTEESEKSSSDSIFQKTLSNIWNGNSSSGNPNSTDNTTPSSKKRAGQITMLAGGAGMVVGGLGMGASKILGSLSADGESSGPTKRTEAADQVIDEAEISDLYKDINESRDKVNGQNTSLLRKSSGGSASSSVTVDEDWSSNPRGVVLTPDNWDSVMADETDSAWVIFGHSGGWPSNCGTKQAVWDKFLPELVARYQDPDSEEYNPRVKFGLYNFTVNGFQDCDRINMASNGAVDSHFQFLAAGTPKEKDYWDKGTEDQSVRLDTLAGLYKWNSKTNFEDLTSAIDQQVADLPESPGSTSSSGWSRTGNQCCDNVFIGFLIVFVLSLAAFLGGLLLICAAKFFPEQ